MPLNHSSQYAELTDDHFKIIGKIVIEWSNIEYLLGELAARLLLTPAFLGRSYADRLAAAKRQEIIEEAIQIHQYRYGCAIIDKIILEEIKRLNNEITKLRGTRNKIAHFCWARSTDEEIFGNNLSGGVLNSKKHKRALITLKSNELNFLYASAYEMVDRLARIIEQIPENTEDAWFSPARRGL